MPPPTIIGNATRREVVHDTTAQTPEEEAWLKQNAEDS